MNFFQETQEYKEAGAHRSDTIDVNDCFTLNSNGNARITCVKGWADNVTVYGLEIFYNGNSNGPKISKYMPNGVQSSDLFLQPNEDIKEISGYTSHDIDSLTFFTTTGRAHKIGSRSSGKYFCLSIPSKVVSKIKFGTNEKLHYIGAFFGNNIPNNMMGQLPNLPFGGSPPFPNMPAGQPPNFQPNLIPGCNPSNNMNPTLPNPNMNFTGGQGGVSNQPYGNMNQGNPPFPNQQYPNQPYGNMNQGNQPFPNNQSPNQPYGNMNQGNPSFPNNQSPNQPYGNMNQANQPFPNNQSPNQPYGNMNQGNQPFPNQQYQNQPYGNINQGNPQFPNQQNPNQQFPVNQQLPNMAQFPQGQNQGFPNQGFNQGGIMNPNQSPSFPNPMNPMGMQMGFLRHNLSTVQPTNKVGYPQNDSKLFDDFNTVMNGIIQQGKRISIDEIDILHDGLYVLGIKVEFKAKDSNGNEVELKQKHVGKNKNPSTYKEEHYKFTSGEFVTEIYGRAGPNIDQLYFRTSSGKTFGGGGYGGQPFSIMIPPGKFIIGFGGAVGGYLSQLFAYAAF